MIKLILSILTLVLSSLFFPAVINDDVVSYHVTELSGRTHIAILDSVGFWGPSATLCHVREDTNDEVRLTGTVIDTRQRNV